MTKPKPLPKKVIIPVQKKQNKAQSKKLLLQQKSFTDNPASLLIVILVITFLAFLPSLSNDFIKGWDDGAYVIDNPLITHLNWESIKGFFTTQRNGTYVPLPLLSWALEFKFFALNPFPYHLNNLLLHLLCTSLVFYFLILVRIPLLYAAFGALLFGIHPMRVESVAWVTERKDLLYSVFYLGGLITYVKYITSENRKPRYFLLTLLLFVFSLFSKIQAVSLPLTFFLLDYWFARPLKWKLFWEKIPFFVLSLGFGLAGYFIIQHFQVTTILDKYSLPERVLLGLFSLSAYLVRLIVPWNLSILYPYPAGPGESMPFLYWLNPVLLITIGILIWFTIRRTKAVVFGFLFFLINVIFLLQFVRSGYGYQVDRYTYISYIGLFFLAIWAAHKFAERNKTNQSIITGLAIVVAVFFFTNTYARCKDWKDNITLWTDVIEKYPDKIALAYSNRGAAYGSLGQMDKAIADESEAIRIDPKLKDAYYNRGIVYGNVGQWENAIADYTKALEFDKNLLDAYINRGFAYSNLGQWDKTIVDYTRTIEIDPGYKDGYYNRGLAYGQTGKWDKAITDYTRAVTLDRLYTDAYMGRSVAYGSLGQWEKAVDDCSRAIEIAPGNADSYCNRGIAYGHLGQWDKALTDFSSAITIDPNNKRAYYNRENANNKLQSQVK